MLRSVSAHSRTSVRKSQASEAFLAHRLTRQQLDQLVSSLDSSEGVWTDTFERLTERGNDTAAPDFLNSGQDGIELLGLRERFAQLDDNQVWTREERALYRQFAHSQEAPSKPSGPEVKPKAEPKTSFTSVVQQNFSSWDRNGDSRLDGAETDQALSGGFYGEFSEAANTKETAAALVVLKVLDNYLASADPVDGQGVSLRDTLLLEQASTGVLAQIKEVSDDEYSEQLAAAQGLKPMKPLDQEVFDPKAIHQGAPGSCVLLSTAAGLSEEKLASMFRSTDNGAVEVRFADGESQTVTEPTLAERLYHARGVDTDRWPALLEKAMVQRLYLGRNASYDSFLQAIEGIEPEQAIKAMTGLEADRRNLDELTVRETRRALSDLTSSEGPVICATRPTASSDFISVEDLHNGLPNGHAFTVLGFDEDSDLVTLRNPWGHGEWQHQSSPDDGIFQMPLRDFYSSYRWVAGTAGAPDSNR